MVLFHWLSGAYQIEYSYSMDRQFLFLAIDDEGPPLTLRPPEDKTHSTWDLFRLTCIDMDKSLRPHPFICDCSGSSLIPMTVHILWLHNYKIFSILKSRCKVSMKKYRGRKIHTELLFVWPALFSSVWWPPSLASANSSQDLVCVCVGKDKRVEFATHFPTHRMY